MTRLPQAIEAEVAELARRYGTPRRVEATLAGRPFHPLSLEDRYGEVCMVVRRTNGRILTAIKSFYPSGAFRLLTGGVNHGEGIEAALLRETREETGLEVAVRRFLAVIEYRRPPDGDVSAPPDGPDFVTFAFLLDELGGVLGNQDEGERIAEFREVAVDELPLLAERLDQAPDADAPEVGGNWRDWGRFRAVVHRVVHAALTSP
jgi:NAD+ diphosphatase